MKDEPRNRSVWERVKMAFRLLFSVKALEPVYKEGWEDGRKKIVKCKFTRAEYIEFSQLWEWHRKNYLAERKRMRELFKIAYFDKFKMYASETCDEYEAQRSKKKDDDFTFEDLMAINMMAAACKNKSFYKQIGEVNDDEEDD